jgi:hypothetical protein
MQKATDQRYLVKHHITSILLVEIRDYTIGDRYVCKRIHEVLDGIYFQSKSIFLLSWIDNLCA